VYNTPKKMGAQAKIIRDGAITSPKGFSASAVDAGIKAPHEHAADLGLLYSEAPCTAAGLFTTNVVKAAPVILCQKVLGNNRAQALIVNSGYANACTGQKGHNDAAEMGGLAAEKLRIAPDDVLVASTGVIGRLLPMDRIKAGITSISLSPEGGHDFAQAMMTTDTFPKEVAVSTQIGNDTITIGGAAKGAGMIHPNMATFLSFITTDASIEVGLLEQALRRAVDISFNMVTIDGDTSTNDMVLLLANGMATSSMLQSGTSEAADFEAALQEVCLHLAKEVARDGEGATRLIEVTVNGAATVDDARRASRTIASSPLVKTAVHGCDPNWGRIMAALGRSGAEVSEDKVDIYVGDICLVRSGCGAEFDEGEAKAKFVSSVVPLTVSLNLGNEAATAWGCDLSHDYVTINSAYTT
jgi:glutamate N-acetyltransferase/amino-acid N-acetyltransferase